MRLLLDALCPPGIAEALRARGHDVVSLHDPSHTDLRGRSDAEVLSAAAREDRAVVTENARRFLPRHRPDLFVRAMVRELDALLDALLDADGDREPNGRVVWLRPAG